METARVGILGCGVISRTYVGDIQRFYKNLEVVACSAAHLESAQSLADEFGIPRVYCGTDILRDDDIDIIVNLTPPEHHVALNRAVINAGKHLFSEKPFALSLKDAREILSLAEEKGVTVGCAPDTFLGSGLQSVRYYLDAGLIGRPFFLSANMTTFGPETWHPDPGFFYKKTCGPLLDMGPYYLSAIVTLLGPIESVAAVSAKPSDTRHVYVGKMAGTEIPVETPTHFSAILRMKSGAVANLNVSFDIYRSELPMLEICGDGGTLSYPDPNFGGGTPRVYRREQFTDVIYQQTEDALLRRESFRELPELYPRKKDYSRGIGVSELAEAIRDRRTPRTGGDLILHVTEAMEGILRSAETGGFYRMTTDCARPDPLERR